MAIIVSFDGKYICPYDILLFKRNTAMKEVSNKKGGALVIVSEIVMLLVVMLLFMFF